MTPDESGERGPAALPPALEQASEGPRRPSAALAPILTALGVLFVVLGFSSGALEFVDEHLGFRRVVAASLGFSFLYVAWLARSHTRVRGRMLDLMEEVLKVFYGPNFRRDRQAIDILVKAMESDNPSVRRSSAEHLKRLTGRDHGEDAAAWAAWWESARSGYRSPDAPASPTGRGDGS